MNGERQIVLKVSVICDVDSYSMRAITYPYNGVNQTHPTQLQDAFEGDMFLADYDAHLFLTTHYKDVNTICSLEWEQYEGEEFRVFSGADAATHSVAAARCATHGGTLGAARPSQEDRRLWLAWLLNKLSIPRAYVGLTKNVAANRWDLDSDPTSSLPHCGTDPSLWDACTADTTATLAAATALYSTDPGTDPAPFICQRDSKSARDFDVTVNDTTGSHFLMNSPVRIRLSEKGYFGAKIFSPELQNLYSTVVLDTGLRTRFKLADLGELEIANSPEILSDHDFNLTLTNQAARYPWARYQYTYTSPGLVDNLVQPFSLDRFFVHQVGGRGEYRIRVDGENDVSESWANATIYVSCHLEPADAVKVFWTTYPYNGEATLEREMKDAEDISGGTRNLVIADYPVYLYMANHYSNDSFECSGEWIQLGTEEFLLVKEAHDYPNAEAYCSARQGQLIASPFGASVEDAMVLFNRFMMGEDFWTGGTRSGGSGPFTWAGTAATLQDTSPALEPGATLDHVYFRGFSKLLATSSPTSAKKFICQRSSYPPRTFQVVDSVDASVNSGAAMGSPVKMTFPRRPDDYTLNIASGELSAASTGSTGSVHLYARVKLHDPHTLPFHLDGEILSGHPYTLSITNSHPDYPFAEYSYEVGDGAQVNSDFQNYSLARNFTHTINGRGTYAYRVAADNLVSYSHNNDSINAVCDVESLEKFWATYPYNGEATLEREMRDAEDLSPGTLNLVIANYPVHLYIANRYHNRSEKCSGEWIQLYDKEYLVVSLAQTYTAAQAYCAFRQGNLVGDIIEDHGINATVLFHRFMRGTEVWTGGNRVGASGPFVWDGTGGTLGDSDPLFGGSAGTGTSVFLGADANLASAPSTHSKAFVCERPAYPSRTFTAVDSVAPSVSSGAAVASPVKITFPGRASHTLNLASTELQAISTGYTGSLDMEARVKLPDPGTLPFTLPAEILSDHPYTVSLLTDPVIYLHSTYSFQVGDGVQVDSDFRNYTLERNYTHTITGRSGYNVRVAGDNRVSYSHNNKTITAVCDVEELDMFWVTFRYNGDVVTEQELKNALDHDGNTRYAVLAGSPTTLYIASKYQTHSTECSGSWYHVGESEYEVVTTPSSYANAKAYCEARQGHLLSPSSDIDAQLAFVNRILPGEYAWVGLTRTDLAATDWNFAEPGFVSPLTSCAAQWAVPCSQAAGNVVRLGPDGKLSDDSDTGTTHKFVCQRDAYPERKFKADNGGAINSGLAVPSPITITFPDTGSKSIYNVVERDGRTDPEALNGKWTWTCETCETPYEYSQNHTDQSEVHQYMYPAGTFHVDVVLSDGASEAVFGPKEMIVRPPLSGQDMLVSFGFSGSTLPTEQMVPAEPGVNYTIMGYPVRFDISYSVGNATLHKLVAKHADGTTVLMSGASAADFMTTSLTFPKTGNWSLTLYEIESGQNLTSTIVLNVIEEVPGFGAVELGPSNWHEAKRMQIAVNTGNALDDCMIIDFNDGTSLEKWGEPEFCGLWPEWVETAATSMGPLTQDVLDQVSHVYDVGGVYSPLVTLGNPVSSRSFTMAPFTVTNHTCYRPSIQIPNFALDPTAPTTVSRKNDIAMAALIGRNCTLTDKTKRLWTVQKIDPTTLANTGPPPLPAGTIVTTTDLNILKKKLNFGTYKATMKATVDLEGIAGYEDRLDTIFEEKTVYFNVIPADIVARVTNNIAEMTVGTAEVFTLNPAFLSLDDNQAAADGRPVFDGFAWACKEESEGWPSSNPFLPGGGVGGCFGGGPGLIDEHQGNVTLHGIAFSPDTKYDICTQVTKNFDVDGTIVEKKSDACVRVKIVLGQPPSVELGCVAVGDCITALPTGFRAEPTLPLPIQGDCTSCSNDPDEQPNFSWDIEVYDLINPAIPGLYEWRVIENTSGLVTGTDGKLAEIQPALWASGNEIATVKLVFSAQFPGASAGSAETLILANKPPVKGSCTPDPSSGQAVTTQFTISCTGWTDPDAAEIAKYRFYTKTTAGVEETLQNTASPIVSTFLSLSANTVYVKVEDVLGGVSKEYPVTIPVHSSPPLYAHTRPLVELSPVALGTLDPIALMDSAATGGSTAVNVAIVNALVDTLASPPLSPTLAATPLLQPVPTATLLASLSPALAVSMPTLDPLPLSAAQLATIEATPYLPPTAVGLEPEPVEYDSFDYEAIAAEALANPSAIGGSPLLMPGVSNAPIIPDVDEISAAAMGGVTMSTASLLLDSSLSPEVKALLAASLPPPPSFVPAGVVFYPAPVELTASATAQAAAASLAAPSAAGLQPPPLAPPQVLSVTAAFPVPVTMAGGGAVTMAIPQPPINMPVTVMAPQPVTLPGGEPLTVAVPQPPLMVPATQLVPQPVTMAGGETVTEEVTQTPLMVTETNAAGQPVTDASGQPVSMAIPQPNIFQPVMQLVPQPVTLANGDPVTVAVPQPPVFQPVTQIAPQPVTLAGGAPAMQLVPQPPLVVPQTVMVNQPVTLPGGSPATVVVTQAPAQVIQPQQPAPVPGGGAGSVPLAPLPIGVPLETKDAGAAEAGAIEAMLAAAANPALSPLQPVDTPAPPPVPFGYSSNVVPAKQEAVALALQAQSAILAATPITIDPVTGGKVMVMPKLDPVTGVQLIDPVTNLPMTEILKVDPPDSNNPVGVVNIGGKEVIMSASMAQAMMFGGAGISVPTSPSEPPALMLMPPPTAKSPNPLMGATGTPSLASLAAASVQAPSATSVGGGTGGAVGPDGVPLVSPSGVPLGPGGIAVPVVDPYTGVALDPVTGLPVGGGAGTSSVTSVDPITGYPKINGVVIDPVTNLPYGVPQPPPPGVLTLTDAEKVAALSSLGAIALPPPYDVASWGAPAGFKMPVAPLDLSSITGVKSGAVPGFTEEQMAIARGLAPPTGPQAVNMAAAASAMGGDAGKPGSAATLAKVLKATASTTPGLSNDEKAALELSIPPLPRIPSTEYVGSLMFLQSPNPDGTVPPPMSVPVRADTKAIMPMDVEVNGVPMKVPVQVNGMDIMSIHPSNTRLPNGESVLPSLPGAPASLSNRMVQDAVVKLDFIPIPMSMSACDSLKGGNPGNPSLLYSKCLEGVSLFIDTVNTAAAEMAEKMVDTIMANPLNTDDPQSILPVLDSLSKITASSMTTRIVPGSGSAAPAMTMGMDTTAKVMEVIGSVTKAISNPAVLNAMSESQRNAMVKQVMMQVDMVAMTSKMNNDAPLLGDQKKAMEETYKDMDTVNVTPEDPDDMVRLEELTEKERGEVMAKIRKAKKEEVMRKQMEEIMTSVAAVIAHSAKAAITSGNTYSKTVKTGSAEMTVSLGPPGKLLSMPVGDIRTDGYSIGFPSDTCAVIPSACDPDRIVQANVVKFTNNMFSSAKGSESVTGGIVDLAFKDELGRALLVKDSEGLIEINLKAGPEGALEVIGPLPLFPASVPLKKATYMRYHDIQVKKPNVSVQAVFRPLNDNASYALFWKFDEKPSAEEGVYEDHILVPRVPVNGTRKRTHWWLDYEGMIMNRQGTFWLGVAELADEYTNASCIVNIGTPHSPTPPLAYIGRLGGPYSINRCPVYNYGFRAVTKGCYYYDARVDRWHSSGMSTKKSFALDVVKCTTNHLTPFGAGLVTAPNTIDFDYVFANASFANNLSIYVAILVVYLVFCILCIWSRIMDIKDKKKLGAIPLQDNDPNDKYVYEIIFFTGYSKGAATDSNISFVLSGDQSETEVREIFPKECSRKPFRNGSADSFVMTSKHPLGPLQYLRVWHDNTGGSSFRSWFLSRVVVVDCQTGVKYPFVVDRWLAVDEEDGMIERMVPISGLSELANFDTLFSKGTKDQLTDGHLWFSVFARPAQSRFTRVQRVTCCMSLLMTSMVVSAMWYGTVVDDGGSQGMKMGPFSISMAQIGVGIMSNLIVIPINILIVHFFRKARLREPRSSRVAEALRKANHPLPAPEVLPPRKRRSCLGTINGNLPWWLRQVAWVLAIASIVTSTVFVLFYGISFGDEKARDWLTSMVVSLFTSILFTQPLKILFVAVFFSLMCSKLAAEDNEDEEENEKILALRDDEVYMDAPKENAAAAFMTKDSDELFLDRADRMQEKKMWGIVREIVVYMFFLWVVLIMAYGSRLGGSGERGEALRDLLSYEFTKQMRNSFLGLNEDREFVFMQIRHPSEFYSWAKKHLVPALRGKWYNEDPAVDLRGFTEDKVSRIMGYAIIRQIRHKPDQEHCKMYELVTPLFTNCIRDKGLFTEDKTDYGLSWTPDGHGISREYKYKSADSMGKGLPMWGQFDTYGGGGYIVPLTRPHAQLSAQFDELEKEGWMDNLTRAVVVEWGAYNGFVNMFSVNYLLLEMPGTGALEPSYRFDPVRLFRYHSSGALFIIAAELIFIIYILVFMVKEMLALKRQGWRLYFSQFWSWIEIAIITLSIAAGAFYVSRFFVARGVADDFEETHGNVFVKLQWANFLDATFVSIQAIVLFLANLKFLKLLRFNRRIAMFGDTIRRSRVELTYFSIVFGCVYVGIVGALYMLLRSKLYAFSTFVASCKEAFSAMLGKFEFQDIVDNSAIAPWLFFLFNILQAMILINMFITIVTVLFQEIKEDAGKRSNDYEVIDTIKKKVRAQMGIKTLEASRNMDGAAKKEVGVLASMDDKTDRVIRKISKNYLSGTLDVTDVEAKARAQIRHNQREAAKQQFLSP